MIARYKKRLYRILYHHMTGYALTVEEMLAIAAEIDKGRDIGIERESDEPQGKMNDTTNIRSA